MDLEEKIRSLHELGDRLSNNLKSEWYQAKFKEAHFYNRWFTPENVEKAVEAIALYFLDQDKLRQWVKNYSLPVEETRRIGIVMAGNIPLVGFHDLLAVLLSGHEAVVKLSSKDDKLLPFILEELEIIDPEMVEKIQISDKMQDHEAVIATGSNNTGRYFEYYFGEYPHIIRKNRNSVAVLTGNESREVLHDLAIDIFRYFGLGCRNVSKVYVPENYDFQEFMGVLETYREVIEHKKYENNYLYNKSILVMNNEAFLDTGFFMVREREEIASPMAMLHFEYYKDSSDLKAKLEEKGADIQCIVGAEKVVEEVELKPGKAQRPALWDYPDKRDTLAFLSSLEDPVRKADSN